MPRRYVHPDQSDISLAHVLSALGDPVRLHIMGVLADRQEHQRADFEVDVVASTLSHHMKVLREAGITHQRNEGTRCFVSLRDDTLDAFPGVLGSVLDAVAVGDTAHA
ncbi:ArsR/SmtB family transcription factor [Streptomyces sp. NPDC060205]|uniref:ArsR/SmtB family transcription factor n=1 Tax=Streptomyces sp. NPDC060205 TaxID=3347072 RepID=UPI0036680AC5